MARAAVVCVLFALFVVAAYGQCDTKTLGYSAILSSGSVVVDATQVVGIAGSINFKFDTTDDVVVDFAKNQGWSADVSAPGTVVVKRVLVSAASVNGASALVTLGLAALALVSQRGSLVALVLVVAIATVAMAACATPSTLELTVNIDQKTLKSFELQIKVDSTTSKCPAGFTDVSAADPRLTGAVTVSASGTTCSFKYVNPYMGCDNACGQSGQNGATYSCQGSTCTIATCATNFGNCDNDISNGCEADLTLDANCGVCGTNCADVKNVSPLSLCTMSGGSYSCSFTGCATGYSNCDGSTANGCESSTSADPFNCGGCGTNCSNLAGVDPAGSFECVDSKCQGAGGNPLPCAPGKLNCDSDFATGCEASNTDPATCGSCINNCVDATNGNYASVQCTNGTCDYTCNAGFDDCTGVVGCESSVTSDPGNCGSCGYSCTTLANVTTDSKCVDSKCVIVCNAGFFDCDGKPENGCEVDGRSDTANCGACAKDCATLPHLTGAQCVDSVCTGSCETGFAQCDTTVIGMTEGCPDDVATDPLNCGTCTNDCAASVKNAVTTCTAQTCGYSSCNTGFGDCTGGTADGCETDLTSTVAHCGLCATDCAATVKNAIVTCTASVCGYSSCTGTFKDCDNNKLNGCEVNVATNVSNCNGCGAAYNCATSVQNANAVCVNSVCSYSGACTTGFGDCDANKVNGCEVNTQTNATYCGGCDATTGGVNCATLNHVTASITCAAGKCVTAGACAAGWNDCDANPANGCEVDATFCKPVGAGPGCQLAMKYPGRAGGFDCSTATTNVASSTCSPSTGLCVIKCQTGFEDCNGDPSDGCETVSASCGTAQGSVCETAKLDPLGAIDCRVLLTDPTFNFTVTTFTDPTAKTICQSTGKCGYTCTTNYFDCDGSAHNGCEIDTRICKGITQTADCIFNVDTRCGVGKCVDCTMLSGASKPSTCLVVNASANEFACDMTNMCDSTLCKDLDADWTNGCESAQGYATVGLTNVDCSKDINTTNIDMFAPIICDGNATSSTKGTCKFTCKTGYHDCDGIPINGCETFIDPASPCQSCVYQADVQCGKNKCVDCTLLEGTLGVDYANGRWASASASTCVSTGGDQRVADYVCDTSVHYLHPRFDPPNGYNGACQSELCRDLDGDWTNGCESAQQYGRGRFYYYGDEFNTDVYLTPYVPNPYEARFYAYKAEFLEINPASNDYQNPIVYDIKILSYLDTRPPQKLGLPYYPPIGAFFGLNSLADLVWTDVVGYVQYDGTPAQFLGNFTSVYTPATRKFVNSMPTDDMTDVSYLSAREIVLLHYAAESFTEVDEPAEAAAMSIIGQPYETPVDCELTEWSDWGPCTYADDCISRDFFRQTKIRTRKIVRQASGGGVCHLPLVEDYYRFMHRAKESNTIDEGVFVWNSQTGQYDFTPSNFYGADHQHGGGLSFRVDYTGRDFLEDSVFNVNNTLFWSPEHWNYQEMFYDSLAPTGDWNVNGKYLAWTGDELDDRGDAKPPVVTPNYNSGRLLTCAAQNSCPEDINNRTQIWCKLSQWTAWSQCTAACDGDWAGGVRIRTRDVLVPAAQLGECFHDEFNNDTGTPIVDNAGMLYEEDWQCNDFSCSSFDCTSLRNKAFAAANHIYLGADAVVPQCDGRDWPEYVINEPFVDFNRDGSDDRTNYEIVNFETMTWGIQAGEFQLYDVISNFNYEYRWPGHCLYECVEGWYDCDHDPSNGCETDGNFCSIDILYNSKTQLLHPLLPWEHPHGECTIAWNNKTTAVDCTDAIGLNSKLNHTVGLCYFQDATSSKYGKCDTACDDGFSVCGGKCVRTTPLTPTDAMNMDTCGSKCIDCTQLNRFNYGTTSDWVCAWDKKEGDYTCQYTSCTDNCMDLDKDTYNGCETAIYKQVPYPDVDPSPVVYDNWSDWTNCSYADQCGYLWDLTDGVFRNVPLQTRYRRPVKSAYNGGFYDEFSYYGYRAMSVDGVTFPADSEFSVNPAKPGTLGHQPALKDITGIPIVQTPYYEVRICDVAPVECHECTNQLEGIEVHCTLSAWSDWSACSAECVDRIADPRVDNAGWYMFDTAFNYNPRDISLPNYWILNRQPYQIRTRSVLTPARRGGRCPPPGDTWQVAEAQSHVSGNVISYDNNGFWEEWGNLADGGLLDVAPLDTYQSASNDGITAKASYLVDVRKCNSAECTYPEDCDALNYFFPGHFKGISTCVEYNDFGMLSRCWTADDLAVYSDLGCNEMNGYCGDDNADNTSAVFVDIRAGCDTYVYPTACGRTQGDYETCNYDSFRDCTTLPGVKSTFAAACVPANDPQVLAYDGSSWTNVESHYHRCDIRWACDETLCTDELYHASSTKSVSWLDGCEVARNYRYPFVTVDSAFPYDVMTGDSYDYSYPSYLEPGFPDYLPTGNPMSLMYNFATDGDNNESRINHVTFHDPLDRYILNLTTGDISSTFDFDCEYFLEASPSSYQTLDGNVTSFTYCAVDGIEEPIVTGAYAENKGCHLAGSYWQDEFVDLGFGCQGDASKPNKGMCTFNCAAGYMDADLDPRNGCETDTNQPPTPEDRFPWVGNCAANSSVKSNFSCGADKCVDCRSLPGIVYSTTNFPFCLLAEEWLNTIPVLGGPEDYFAIQYGCGIASGSPYYQGRIEFKGYNDEFCNSKCVDGDNDWENGCEQGRGYDSYTIGTNYDNLFDTFNYLALPSGPYEWFDTKAYPDAAFVLANHCEANFINPGWDHNASTPNYYIEDDTHCDKRSSGFEFPVPGAWFYVHENPVDPNAPFNGIKFTENVLYLGYFWEKVNFSNPNLTTPFANLSRAMAGRAFDCSLPYNLEKLYDSAGNYVGPLKGTKAFYEVNHIDITKYPTLGGVAAVNNLCDRDTGKCMYVCAAGWDDYDGDPSNGCEADIVNSPCSKTTAERRYDSVTSCGEYCMNCKTVPGSYTVPVFSSACLSMMPQKFHYNAAKFEYLLENYRFGFACVTEVLYPEKQHNVSNAFMNAVCDPRRCYDNNFQYEDGCEFATDYPFEWWSTNKTAFNHWVSPVANADGSHSPETTYWVRDDGTVVLGRYDVPPTNTAGDFWVKIFDFLAPMNLNPENSFKDLNGNTVMVKEFFFQFWDIRNIPGYEPYKYYQYLVWDNPSSGTGNNIWPYNDDPRAAYDCSNAIAPSGVSTFTALDGEKVQWAINATEHKGPWYHVNQTASWSSVCVPGNDAGANSTEYPVPAPNLNQWCNTSTPLICWHTFTFPGAGLCKLNCETGWADGDADPTNGCESYLANSKPYPKSKCGSGFTQNTDPALTRWKKGQNTNYNQRSFCGAGVCLDCTTLGGINPAPSDLNAGNASLCVDGGSNWADYDDKAMNKNPTPATDAVGYPGDYFCSNVLNQLACVRSKVYYDCSALNDNTKCPQGYRYASLDGTGAPNGFVLYNASASYIQVCEDRDGLWETGCEYALGYNLNLYTTNQSSTYILKKSDGTNATLNGTYTRSVGVRPYWDNNFYPIDYNGGAEGGFDCEILRYLPRAHTHIVPEDLGSTYNIRCYVNATKLQFGVCKFTCEADYIDCDGNPWNGCETHRTLCGGQSGDCQLQSSRFSPVQESCSINRYQAGTARPSFCDGNRIPLDQWIDWDFANTDYQWDDEAYYADTFEVTDHGLLDGTSTAPWVDVRENNVDPTVSRYTIKGYWDNVDIDYSCRIWMDYENTTLFRQDFAAQYPIPADANNATGRCVIDCDERNGYSRCNANSLGCTGHNTDISCRAPSGICANCLKLPGTKGASHCLTSTNLPAGKVPMKWAVGQIGVDPTAGSTGYSYVYEPVTTEFPMCDTRGMYNTLTPDTAVCDEALCRDYDGDWENGCEFPVNYTTAERSLWEYPGALYGPTIYEGFDCSWISDPQPDAGGRNYGGKTWAQKFHVVINGSLGLWGYCDGKAGRVTSGKCVFECEAGWDDCDGDPTNGCETDLTLCPNCHFATGYDGTGAPVDCRTLVDPAKGFVPFDKAPKCNGREGEDGKCSYYFCNIFEGYCDSQLSHILSDVGCINLATDHSATYCGIDWNWRDLVGNESTVAYTSTYDYEGGRMLDYSVFDGTGSCATCTSLSGYESANAFCQFDPVIAGKTLDKYTYYKPAAAGWIDNGLGYIEFNVVGNTVGDYLCQLHGDYNTGSDGACDRRYCVDEDYFWANGCETAVRYNISVLGAGAAGYQRNLDIGYSAVDWSSVQGAKKRGQSVPPLKYAMAGDNTAFYGVWSNVNGSANAILHTPAVEYGADSTFGFDYHFAFNDAVYGKRWPYSQVLADDNVTFINAGQTSSSVRSQIRGIWCPFLQFWSLSTDNYLTGDCDVFPCPHFAPSTVDTWITCVSNTTLENAGKCNFECNLDDGWKDCDLLPMTGCETDIFNDGTCGSECQRVECNAVDGLNPWYWSECISSNATGSMVSKCDLSICNQSLCRDLDNDWTNGCETAVNYPGGKKYNCRTLNLTALHLASVEYCNGEAGNHWAGKCEFVCEPGWIDCDKDFANGCEHDGSLCQDCTSALGYVSYFDGADFWEFWGPALGEDYFYSVVYGSRFDGYDLIKNQFDESTDIRKETFDQWNGPEPVYAEFHRAYVAAFDCSTLYTTYPGQFVNASVKCDSDIASPTAGLCTYQCDATNGYYDCDGDPRNGCEHQSLHEACGSGGACRNCYFISGVQYPVDRDYDVGGVNDGAMGPYTNGAFGRSTSQNYPSLVYGDVYDQKNVTYNSLLNSEANKDLPEPWLGPLRLGCLNRLVGTKREYQCHLDSCKLPGPCVCCDDNQNGGWSDGCEAAKKYDYYADPLIDETINCGRLGNDAFNGDKPRDTTNYTDFAYHVRQKVGTFGCDSQNITNTVLNTNKGAWRYSLKYREVKINGVLGNESASMISDFEGLWNYFNGEEFPLYYVRGDDKAGTCYFECEYGYEDCDGDVRNGCEVDLSACISMDNEIGWDWDNRKPTNGCEFALGYENKPTGFDCSVLNEGFFVNTTALKPYCAGGQDGKAATGKCTFVCMTDYQDCDGDPQNGCETHIDNLNCNCVDCTHLPGVQAKGLTGPDYETMASTCDMSSGDVNTYKCTLPCDTTLCEDVDKNWKNGCETAKAYVQPRAGSSPYTGTTLTTFDCATWAKDLLQAKKDHISIARLGQIKCEGRANAVDAGMCSFQSACMNIADDNALHNYQDCNNDPRDGCEDTGRWCGQTDKTAAEMDYRGTMSDRCSKANKYFCDINTWFNAIDEPCRDPSTGIPLDYFRTMTTGEPAFECYDLFLNADAFNINVTVTKPYCDRDVTHLETRGDCVFDCQAGWANCNNVASDGCEAQITANKTCSEDCIDCQGLSGADTRQVPYCATDSFGKQRCFFNCTSTNTTGNCEDVDKVWQNGCEVARNNDRDSLAIFVNLYDDMDCSVMQEEAIKNPEFFRHHLHIDLTVAINTSITRPGTQTNVVLPPGSIFCNNGHVSTQQSQPGKCYFACIPGFANTNGQSYDGCEDDIAPDYPAWVQKPSTGLQTDYGGYWIGDYDVEEYINILCMIENGDLNIPVVAPKDVCHAIMRATSQNLIPTLWY